MDIILDAFLKKFREAHDLGELPQHKLFETFAAYCVIKQFHEKDFEPDHFRTGGTGDLGIDAAALMVNGVLFTDPDALKAAIAGNAKLDVHFIIVQAKLEHGFAAAVFAGLASNLEHIFSAKPLALNCNSQVRRLRACVELLYANGDRFHPGLPRISVFYTAIGDPSFALNPQRVSARERVEATHWFSRVEMHAVGSTELRDLYRAAQEAVSAKVVMTKYVPLPAMPDVEQAYLCVVSAKDFVERVLTDKNGHIRRSLFFENVREFQQLTNPVNLEIQRTLQDPERSRRFAIMNNGITIVARSLMVIGDEFQLRDFSVVNGCQTCYVLFFERSSLKPETHLTVRVVVTQDSAAVTDVVQATNRQTVVRGADFESRNEFHKTIEDYFLAHDQRKQLFYERRLGQFGSTGKVSDELVQMTGNLGAGIKRTRIIRRPQLARAFAAVFLDDAWRASRTMRMPEPTIFSTTKDPLPYYTSAAVFYRVEYLLRNGKIPQPYAAAKFHLMAAVKYRLVGDGKLPGSAAKRREACDKILDHMWDAGAAETLFESLHPLLLAARDAERPTGSSEIDAELVRSRSFGEHVKRLTIEAS